jgi:hypothetical protein
MMEEKVYSINAVMESYTYISGLQCMPMLVLRWQTLEYRIWTEFQLKCG